MKVAVVGSRGLYIRDLRRYLPPVWIPLPGIMLLPMVSGSRNSGQTMLGRSAPLRRNRQIVEYADLVLLFWDGSSHGTRHVLELCRTLSKPHHLFTPGDPQN